MKRRSINCLRYPGGKFLVVDEIVKRFPSGIKHYVEPCAGGASVFLYAKANNLAEHTYWINDKYTPVANFWGQLKKSPEYLDLLLNTFLIQLGMLDDKTALEKIKELKNQLDHEPTPENAFRFFVINRSSFSGSTNSGGISLNAVRKRFTMSSIERLQKAAVLLKKTFITNCDAIDIIKHGLYSRMGSPAFLYIDPPYWEISGLYGDKGDMSEFNHEEMAELLKTTPHKFLLSYNDCDKIRELYKWAEIEELTLPYSMSKKKKGAELLIRNY